MAELFLDNDTIIENIIDNLDSDIITINEEGKGTSLLNVELLDEEDFIKKNHVEEVTNPIFFVKEGIPTEDGLLSNRIFGITKQERARTFAFIDLGGVYMHPLCYKVWRRMDSRIKDIAHGTKKYIVENGDFVEDPNGGTGMEFLKKNIDQIKIRSTESRQRDKKIKFLMTNKKHMFIRKFIVIPAYYRDAESNVGHVGVGSLNKHYASLLISARSLKETQEYGLDVSDAVRGRIQETILDIYNILGGTSDDPDAGIGLSSKRGYIKSSVMGKTSDYGSRLVISAPELKVETLDDMMVDMDYCALPLASAIINFYPFIIFNVKRFFENNFYGNDQYSAYDNVTGEIKYVKIKDPLETFSDERIKKELKRFVFGYSDRFSPVEIPTEEEGTIRASFTGKEVSVQDIKSGNISGSSNLIKRDLTWCDIFFMAANEAVRNKHVLITRYPMDSCFNQMVIKPRISTIRETEKVYVNGTYYPFYPKIRQKDIGGNTSDKFLDTLMFSNLMLKGIGGDYDGDQVNVRGVWTEEANEELDKFSSSISNYIDLGGINIRVSTNEAVQSLYCMTKILPDDISKIQQPVF